MKREVRTTFTLATQRPRHPCLSLPLRDVVNKMTRVGRAAVCEKLLWENKSARTNTPMFSSSLLTSYWKTIQAE